MAKYVRARVGFLTVDGVHHDEFLIRFLHGCPVGIDTIEVHRRLHVAQTAFLCDRREENAKKKRPVKTRANLWWQSEPVYILMLFKLASSMSEGRKVKCGKTFVKKFKRISAAEKGMHANQVSKPTCANAVTCCPLPSATASTFPGLLGWLEIAEQKG
jgi:hypothetical protein